MSSEQRLVSVDIQTKSKNLDCVSAYRPAIINHRHSVLLQPES